LSAYDKLQENLKELKSMKDDHSVGSKSIEINTIHMKLVEMRLNQLTSEGQRRVKKLIDDALFEEESGNGLYYLAGTGLSTGNFWSNLSLPSLMTFYF
jgi:hypothetical protein